MKSINIITGIVVLSLMAGCKGKVDKSKQERQEKSIEKTENVTKVAKKEFRKQLSLQGVTFDVIATDEGSINQLNIQPSGLSIDNSMVKHEIDGRVIGVEIEDLDSDGSPEILIYVTSAGSGSYGSVIGYSVNNMKSMSQISFPNITDDEKAGKGYMGHDVFSIVETTFVQRFPIYKKGDTNSNPTGGTRQVQYKLIKGEACKIFKVSKVLDL